MAPRAGPLEKKFGSLEAVQALRDRVQKLKGELHATLTFLPLRATEVSVLLTALHLAAEEIEIERMALEIEAAEDHDDGL